MVSLASSLLGLDLCSALVLAVGAPVLTVVVWWTISYFTSPLRKYPGPFLAGKLVPTWKPPSVSREP